MLMASEFDPATDLGDRAARWRFVQRFAAGWAEPLQPGDGCHHGDLDAAEGQLGVALPAAVREAYVLFGARDDLTSNQDVLLSPDELYIHDDVLVFRAENQGAAHWGVALTGEPDPPVLMRPDLADKDAEAWEPWMERFSMAAVEIVLSESLVDEELADSRDPEDGDSEALEARYTRLGVPDHPIGQVPPIRWFAGADVILRDDAGGWLSVRGRTPEALDAVRDDLPGDWLR
jgi:hypothetical protein